MNENSLSSMDTKQHSLTAVSSAEWSRSFESLFSESVHLPKIQSSFLQKPFSPGFATARPAVGLGSNLSSMGAINNTIKTPLAINPPSSERVYYTIAVRVLEIQNARNDNEDYGQLQVSFSMDGMTCSTPPIRSTNEDRVSVYHDPILFQAMGNPVGTLLVLKLIATRHRLDAAELGMAILDLSIIGVGGRPSEVNCVMMNNEPLSKANPTTVVLSLRICTRRKSFTFSFLRADPVFRRSGYTVCVEGITTFPKPYKKRGLPQGVSYFMLRMVTKVAEEIHGYEVWRAQDRSGKQYTVKKYLIMEAASRSLFVAELDGMLECTQDQAVTFLDAFLDGVKVSIVLDNENGTYLRDALIERGPAPEIVAAIILRQVLLVLVHLHESCSRLHNDIDARNILCLGTGQIRLGGFCHSTKQIGKSAKFCGPYVHMSPERVLGIECSFPSDIWSLGILARELALGKVQFENINAEDQHALFEFKQIVVSQPSPSLKGEASCSDEFRSFVDMCLQKNIRSRWTAADLLRHPFILRYESFTLPAGSWLTRPIRPLQSFASSSPIQAKLPSAKDSGKIQRKGSTHSKSPRYLSDSEL